MTATALRTTDLLRNIIVTLLTPMFLSTTNDVGMARAAALETVRSCTAHTPMDLILIGQMIAFSLATISSVGLSMEEDIPINLVLRLRGNAVSLHRASEKCRLSLPESDPVRDDDRPPTDAERQADAEIIAEVERPGQRAADYPRHFPPSHPNSAPANPTFPPNAPESLDEMKAAMANILTEAGHRTGEGQATPTAAPFDPEKNLRAAWAYAFPEATQEETDAAIAAAMAEFSAETTNAAALTATAGIQPAASHP